MDPKAISFTDKREGRGKAKSERNIKKARAISMGSKVGIDVKNKDEFLQVSKGWIDREDRDEYVTSRIGRIYA